MKRALAALALVASAVAATAVFAQSATKETKRPDLNPGEGWQEQDVSPSKGVQARAWSDLAAGCHLVDFALPATDSVGIEPMRTSFEQAMAKSGLTVSDEAGNGLRIVGPNVTGLATLRLINSPTRSASLLACYWNEREPARCQSICQRVLQEQSKASP